MALTRRMAEHGANQRFFRQALTATVTVLVVVLLTLLIGFVAEILLVILAGTIVGLYLKVSSAWLARRTRAPRMVCLIGIFAAFIGLLVLLISTMAPVVAKEIRILGEVLPGVIKSLEQLLAETGPGQTILQEFRQSLESMQENDSLVPLLQDWAGNLMGFFSSTLGFFIGILLVLLIALYVSSEPQLYHHGILRLLHPNARARGAEVLARLEYVLSWWLVGQLFSMAVLGTSVTIFLLIMDVPLAFLLGLVTAVMTFIPNLGPILAGIPTILVSLTVGPGAALTTLIFIVIIQNIEGWLLTPMVHRRLISMPPALIICVQLVLAALVGLIGVFLAMPLIAIGMVLVQMLYVEDFLGDNGSDLPVAEPVTRGEGSSPLPRPDESP